MEIVRSKEHIKYLIEKYNKDMPKNKKVRTMPELIEALKAEKK